MMKIECDLLSAELQEFIHFIYPMEMENRNIHRYSDQPNVSFEERCLIKEIIKCSQQIKTLKTWKQG